MNDKQNIPMKKSFIKKFKEAHEYRENDWWLGNKYFQFYYGLSLKRFIVREYYLIRYVFLNKELPKKYFNE